MSKHYLICAWRQMLRQKDYTAIHLAGLSLGLACCLLMWVYVRHETSFDDYQPQAERIYRLSASLRYSDTEEQFAMVSMAVGPALQARYPEIIACARFLYSPAAVTITLGDKQFSESGSFPADSQVFRIFFFDWLEGSPETALNRPRSVVLTSSLATKYFGDAPALGQRIRINNNDYQVTGVIRDLPANTDFSFRLLTSLNSFPQPLQEEWNQDFGRTIFYTYLLFDHAKHAADFQQKLDAYATESVNPYWKSFGIDGAIRYDITPLRALHFRTDLQYDTPKGNRAYLAMFGLTAVLVLVIACFNVVNLAVAQSAGRSVESGIRKCVGASRQALIAQFLFESILLTLLAGLLSLGWATLFLPVFNDMADTAFLYQDLFAPGILASLLAAIVVVGVAAGAYSAFFLAGLNPAAVLKGQFLLKGRKGLRQVLVALQFTLSIALIASTLVIRAQMNHMRGQSLGFDRSQVLVAEMLMDTASAARAARMRTALGQTPHIREVGGSMRGVPGGAVPELLMRAEKDGSLLEKHFKAIWIDEHYLNALGIELAAGRNFDRSNGTDLQSAFLVNEAFARQMGWTQPLGKRMQWSLLADNQAEFDGNVVGVVRDFHFESLHNPIAPLALLFEPRRIQHLLIRFDAAHTREAVDAFQTAWKEHGPARPLEFFFLDEYFDRQYRAESRLARIFSLFSTLAIGIAFMGLFGLAAFAAESRTREIGIRRVLGAGEGHLIWLIFSEFFWLLGVSICLGGALAGLAMSRWLENYAFAVPMPYYAFVAAGMAALAAALVAAGYHAFRILRSDPVRSLRYD